MRYDEEASALIIDDDFALPAKFFINEHYDYPIGTFSDPTRQLTQETRVFRCMFENRWGLSIIWGSMTYSTNHNHPHGDWRGNPQPEFDDEPNTVEVGIIMPEPEIRPNAIMASGEIEHELWGDPIGWVTAEQLRWLVGYVSGLDSHAWPQLEGGPYLNRDNDGPYYITYEVRETSNGREAK